MTVRLGIERLCADPALLDGRIGLLTNHTGVLSNLEPSAVAALGSGVRLTALFGPEHGLTGTAQAGESDAVDRDPITGLPVFDTYKHKDAELDAMLVESGINTLAIDLQDVGTRFYTYVWSMYDLMASAARTGITVAVLDRPTRSAVGWRKARSGSQVSAVLLAGLRFPSGTASATASWPVG